MTDFIPFCHQVKYDELSGLHGLKQIYRALSVSRTPYATEIFEHHTDHYLNRCFLDWKKLDPDFKEHITAGMYRGTIIQDVEECL